MRAVQRIDPNFINKILSWFLAGLVGLLIAYVFLIQMLGDIAVTKAFSFLVFFLLFLLGPVLAYFLQVRFAFPCSLQETGSLRGTLLWLGGMFLAGGFITLVYPISVPNALAQADLQIITTADKNPLAASYDVKLIGLYQLNGEPIPLSSMRIGSLWKYQDNQNISSNKKALSKLQFGKKRADGFTLKFLASESSGIIKIVWNGSEQLVDLYSTHDDVRTIQLPQNRLLLALQCLYWISSALLIGLVLFILSVYLSTHQWGVPKQSEAPGNWAVFLYASPLIVFWTMTLLVFWPGLMSFDSLDQWYQMTTGQYNDIHPAFHTFTNWLLTRIYLSPAIIALFQIITLSLVIGWGFYLFRKAGVPRWACWFPLTLLVFSPVNNTLVITLWKDIPYATALLGLSLIIFEISITNGAWLQKPYAWLLLGLTTASVSLFRHNGLPVVLACLIVLGIVFKSHWRTLILATLLLLGVFWIVVGPLYKLAKVDTSLDRSHIGLRMFHYFAAYTNSRFPFDDEDLKALEKIWPLQDPLPYDCYISDTTAMRVSREAVVGNLSSLQDVLVRIVKENPGIAVRHLLCASSLVWEISQPEEGYFFAYELNIYLSNKYYQFKPGQFKIQIHSLLPSLQKFYVYLIETTTIWPLWRPALYLYLSIFCGIIFSIRRRSWKDTLFLLPVVFQSMSLFIINSTQEVRYQYPVYLVSLLSLALIFTYRKEPNISGDENNIIFQNSSYLTL